MSRTPNRRMGLLLLALTFALAGAIWWTTDSRQTVTTTPASATSSTERQPALADSNVANSETASTAVAPMANPAAAATTAAPGTTRDPGARTQERLVAVHARMDRLVACLAARKQRPDSERLTEWARSLPDAALADAQDDYAAALTWAQQSCAGIDPGSDEDWARLLSLGGFRPDDPLLRLMRAQFPVTGKADPAAVRSALYAVLESALAEPSHLDFLTLVNVAGSTSDTSQLGRYIGPSDEYSALWLLAACDLGADCSRTSAIVRTTCLSELLCGYGSLEDALLDAYIPPNAVAAFQRARRELVTSLRANGGAGIFESPRPGDG
jgi:hypothetical protein